MLDTGAEMTVLSEEAAQRAQVVSFVTGRDTTKSVDWAPGMMCTGARAARILGAIVPGAGPLRLPAPLAEPPRALRLILPSGGG